MGVQGTMGSPELRHRAVLRGNGGPLLGVSVKDKQNEGPLSPPLPTTHTPETSNYTSGPGRAVGMLPL